MNDQDVEFVDWMPKELDVWLKQMSKRKDFMKIASNLVYYIKRLADDTIEDMNLCCADCGRKSPDCNICVNCENIETGEKKILCDECYNMI